MNESCNSATPRIVPGKLRRRAEFLAMRGGDRQFTRHFVLQSRRRRPDETSGDAPRFGFTVTRKAGMAVERNRIRRRLREAVRLLAPAKARPGCDYVLIGQRSVLDAAFSELQRELCRALEQAGRKPERRGAGSRNKAERPGRKA